MDVDFIDYLTVCLLGSAQDKLWNPIEIIFFIINAEIDSGDRNWIFYKIFKGKRDSNAFVVMFCYEVIFICNIYFHSILHFFMDKIVNREDKADYSNNQTDVFASK